MMKTITAKSPHDSSFSFSRRYFNWKKKVEDDEEEEEILTLRCDCEEGNKEAEELRIQVPSSNSQLPLVPAPRKKLPIVAVSKLRSALSVFCKNRSAYRCGLGSRVIGTLFGYRRGHVHFAFQEEAKSSPAFLVQLATPTSVLVREMASGLVRIALECERKTTGRKGVKLLEEAVWRTYCNGKKCGFAMRRECGAEEWKVLKAVEPISMGAGVLPLPLPGNCNGSSNSNSNSNEGELMYMRAKFERVVGSKDSEAFYMLNPDGSGGPELSVYLLRV